MATRIQHEMGFISFMPENSCSVLTILAIGIGSDVILRKSLTPLSKHDGRKVISKART
jgi:hypothetical protein